MKLAPSLAVLLFALTLRVEPQTPPRAQASNRAIASSPLEVIVPDFQVSEAITRDGLSELSLKNIPGLHLGFEEIIRERMQDDPRTAQPHFSVHVQNYRVRQILDLLCSADPRYIWSQDAATINVYPRETPNDSAYLMNMRIGRIEVTNATDPHQASALLAQIFPQQQIGYIPPRLGEFRYAQSWTVTFQDLTVRQFINRLAEHIDPTTSWIWQGGQQERAFTFLKGGFHTR